MARRIFNILVLLAIAIATFLVLYKCYHRYIQAYKPENELVKAAIFLEASAQAQLNANENLLAEIVREFNRTYPAEPYYTKKELSQLRHSEQETIDLQKVKAAKNLHKSSTSLFSKLLEDSSAMIPYGNKLYRIREINPLKKSQTEEFILQAKIKTSEAHAALVWEKLIHFLQLTSGYAKTRKSESRYANLKKLAGTNPEAFYDKVYNPQNAYLVLPTLAIIRNSVAAIEEDCLNDILLRIARKDENPVNGIFLPYLKTQPHLTDQGDTLVFSVALATPPGNKFHIPVAFLLPHGTIDSISKHSVAYVTIPTKMAQQQGNLPAVQKQKKEFAIKLHNPYSKRDTIFRKEIDYWVKTGKELPK